MSAELDPDCELPPHLLRLFLRTSPAMMSEVVAAFHRGDAEMVRATAHKLKGSLYAAGASSLAEDLESLRALALTGDLETCRAALHQMEADLRDVIAELTRRADAEGA
jgi:HPt (histidine-containing phosphotransfer) domain-containing protein